MRLKLFTHFSTFKQPKLWIKMAASWCCHYRQKLYYWGYERFYGPTPSLPCLQRPQSIQTISIHTTKNRSQHSRRGEGHGNLEWKGVKGVIETLTSRLQSMLLSDFDILISLYCSTSKLTCFWAIFHRLRLLLKLQSGLGGRPKIYTWLNYNHETILPLIHLIADC